MPWAERFNSQDIKITYCMKADKNTLSDAFLNQGNLLQMLGIINVTQVATTLHYIP